MSGYASDGGDREGGTKLTFSMAIIPAAATRESVNVDLPAGYQSLLGRLEQKILLLII